MQSEIDRANDIVIRNKFAYLKYNVYNLFIVAIANLEFITNTKFVSFYISAIEKCDRAMEMCDDVMIDIMLETFDNFHIAMVAILERDFSSENSKRSMLFSIFTSQLKIISDLKSSTVQQDIEAATDVIIANKREYLKCDVYDISIAAVSNLEYVSNESFVKSYVSAIKNRNNAIKNYDGRKFSNASDIIDNLNFNLIAILKTETSRKIGESEMEFSRRSIMYKIFKSQYKLYETQKSALRCWV